MSSHQKNTALFGGTILLIFGLIAFYWGYLIMMNVFTPLLFAMIFSVVFFPLYQWLLKKTKSEVLSSGLTLIIFLLLVLAVISFTIYLAVGEVVDITKVLTKDFDFQSIAFLRDQDQVQLLIDQTISNLNTMLAGIPFVSTSLPEVVTEVLKNIPPLLQQLSSYLIGFLKIGVGSAAGWIVEAIIFFISFFFLLIDGKKFISYTFDLLPVNALHERQITKRFSSLCYSWIVVSLLLAFIQGSFAAIGFAIVGVPSPFIWGLITMFMSFIPFVGSGLIWAPIGIIYLILGKWGAGIFILIWGFLLVSSIDNFLRPFLLKEGVKIHPLILFLAVFGGFYAFGVPGLIIGPLVMVFISTLLYIYELEFAEELSEFHGTKFRKSEEE